GGGDRRGTGRGAAAIGAPGRLRHGPAPAVPSGVTHISLCGQGSPPPEARLGRLSFLGEGLRWKRAQRGGREREAKITRVPRAIHQNRVYTPGIWTAGGPPCRSRRFSPM